MKKTERGFNIYSECIKDSEGSEVSIVESSAAGVPRCRLYIYPNKLGYPDSKSEAVHLTKGQARRIAKALLKFSDEDKK